MRLKRLSPADIEHEAYCLAQGLGWTEPIPPFDTRFPGRLESCLLSPFVQFGRKLLYRGLVSKAAALFYLMNKNHPFQNGNKRLAMTTLTVFLYMNNKWLQVDTNELYEFAKWVAATPTKSKNWVVPVIEGFTKEHLVPLNKN